MQRKSGFLAALAVVLTCFIWGRAAAEQSPSSPAQSEAERLARFETLLDAANQSGDYVGLAVAIIRGGETVFLRTYGAAEAGGAPITPETVFRVASLSKGFASTLAAMAVEEGLLSLDTPVNRYAPNFALPGSAPPQITLEQILSHQTGLTPNAYDNLLEAGVAVSDILPKYRTAPTICRVGACYSYQNIPFDLIKHALSSVYGASYEEIAAERLFRALDMHHASFGEAGLAASRQWARPHVRDRLTPANAHFRPWRAVLVRDAYYKVPAAGGVNASILDMAAWLKAQMGYAQHVIPAAVLENIHRPRIATPAETVRLRTVSNRYGASRYALGWRRYDYAGRAVVAHSGAVDGYAAQIAFAPDHDFGIVVLANARSKRVWALVPTLLDIEFGLPPGNWLELDADVAAGAAQAL